VLAFYPADWSPVCGDQMALYNEALPEFEQYGATILGISVDGAWCHDAFAKARNLHFPLLADFEPKARWPGNTAPIARVTASANVRCS
jgi:peroxiredoxin